MFQSIIPDRPTVGESFDEALKPASGVCLKCGTALGEAVKFCPDCGARREIVTRSNDSAVETAMVTAPAPIRMNQFQKNSLFIALIVCVLTGGGFFVQHTIQARARAVEEQKVQWKKANIKLLKDLSAIGALSNEEQVRVDNAGDDLDRLQQVLLDIHQERLTFWRGQLEDIDQREHKLQGMSYTAVEYGLEATFTETQQELSRKEQKAKENIAGYFEAATAIRSWKPVSFADYQAGKMIDPHAPPPKSDAVQQ